MMYGVISCASLKLKSEDTLDDFISKGIETNWEIFGFVEFVRLECCSTHIMNAFFDGLSDHFSEIDASLWATVRARLVLSDITPKVFPPSVKKGMYFDVPDEIIAHVMGSHADWTVASCRRRLQLSAFARFLRCNRCLAAALQ
jgi:hypothetical protein